MINNYPRCRSRVYPPSHFEALSDAERASRVKELSKVPRETLSLRHVFGSASQNQCLVSVGSQIAFAASSTVVLWDPAAKPSPPQRFFRGKHRDEITALASHPVLETVVASSELGFIPSVMVWSTDTCKLIAPRMDLLERSVSCCALSFAGSGEFIVAITNDQNHSATLFKWRSGEKLCEARSGPSPVAGILRVTSNDAQSLYGLASYGKRHLRFWTLQDGRAGGVQLNSNMSPTKSDINCAIGVCGRTGIVVAGTKGGALEVWIQNKIKSQDGASILDSRGTLIATHTSTTEHSPITALCECPCPPPLAIEERHSVSPEHHDKAATFASGRQSGGIVLHRLEIGPDGVVIIMKLLEFSVLGFAGYAAPDLQRIQSMCFVWGMWDRRGGTGDHQPARRPRKIRAGSKAASRSMFMNANVLKAQSRINGAHNPVSPVSSREAKLREIRKQTTSQKPAVPEPVLVVNTADGCFYSCAAKVKLSPLNEGELSSATASDPEAIAFSDPIRSKERWKSGLDVYMLHQGHSASVESVAHVHRFIISSVSRDGTLKLWNIDKNSPIQCIGVQTLAGSAVSVAVDCEATVAACGLTDGRFCIVSLRELSKVGPASSIAALPLPIAWKLGMANVCSIRASYSNIDEAVQCMAFSPDRSALAVGSRDNHAYIFKTKPELPAPACYEYLQTHCLAGHSSFIVSLDWSADSCFLQTNDASREILYWSYGNTKFSSGSHKLSPFSSGGASLRDHRWATWTCIFGWGVSGIWDNTSDATDVNTTSAVDSLLAIGDDMMNVRLYNYPCLPGAKYSSYAGHHSHVMCVRIIRIFEDHPEGGKQTPVYMCISAGGLDKCVFVWDITKA